MGTDIHPIVEVRRNGQWFTHKPKVPYRYAGSWKGAPKFALPEYFSDRNYFMFAVLGNVRNGFGFAGVPTFKPVTPLSDCRGIPSDYAAGTASWVREIDHSESWVTLKELEEYDWSQTFMEGGVVQEATFIRCLVNRENPKMWSGGISGPQIQVVTTAQYVDLFGKPTGPLQEVDPATRTYDPKARYYIQMEWAEFFLNAAPQIPKIIEYLRALVPPKGSSDDVRLLFYFDS